MFDVKCIYELASGNLSEKSYKSIVDSIASLVRKNNWQKSIIVSENPNSDYWTADDIKELAHQFFEFAITKRKLNALNTIPEHYLSYYFTKIFISFVVNIIANEQQKTGLSYKKCHELVFEISKEKYYSKMINGRLYVSFNPFKDQDFRIDIDNHIFPNYLSPYKISEATKHYKPIVEMILEDVLILIDRPIDLSKLIKIIFKLLDQRFFTSSSEEETVQEEQREDNPKKHQIAIRNLLTGLSKIDARIIFEYLFQPNGEVSLSALKEKYQLPLARSTIHYIIKSFKKKMTNIYTVENEGDGILFMENLSIALDKLAK
jgi:hypothetical protein